MRCGRSRVFGHKQRTDPVIKCHFRESLPEAMSDCLSEELQVEMGMFIGIPGRIEREGVYSIAGCLRLGF